MLNERLSYVFDPEKNRILKETRGVNFDDAIIAIAEGKILGIHKHPNFHKYPEQLIAILQIGEYAYQMPFVIEDGNVMLKTVYASRKATKYYLASKEEINNE